MARATVKTKKTKKVSARKAPAKKASAKKVSAKKEPARRSAKSSAKKSRPAKRVAPKRRTTKTVNGHAKPSTVIAQWQDQASDWLAFASTQRSRLVREVKGLGDEIVDKISTTPVFANRDDTIREAREQIESLLKHLDTSSLLERAKDSARMTRQEILAFFNIPSENELKQLQKKLNRIEDRMVALKKLDRTSRRSAPRSRKSP